jgi:O-methyltransferase involved in polyketide biosynthesis
VAKFLGISDTFGTILKQEEQKQMLRQCESELSRKTEWLAGTYRNNYEQAVKESIEQMVETEGMSLQNCEIMWNEQETEIADIYLQIGEGGTVTEVREVEVTVFTQEETQTVESPQIIKIRNEIIEYYQIEEEHIFIEQS